MTEALMIFALGFLLATLLALMAAQFIWRRAVASTTKRLTEEGAVQEPAPEPLPAASNEAETSALRQEAEAARNDVIAERQESARLSRALEEAQNQARTAESALTESSETLTAREAEIARLEAKLRSIKDAAAETAREAASTLSKSQHLTALLTEPAPAAPAEKPMTEPAPAIAVAAAPIETAPASESATEAEDGYEDVKAELISFSEDIRAAFGQSDEEDAESDSALQRNNPGEIRPSQSYRDQSLEDRIRALQDGAPRT